MLEKKEREDSLSFVKKVVGPTSKLSSKTQETDQSRRNTSESTDDSKDSAPLEYLENLESLMTGDGSHSDGNTEDKAEKAIF